jgi:hypothetical protein
MSYQLPIPGPTEPLHPYDQSAPQPQAQPPVAGKAEQLKTTVSPLTRRRFFTFCGVVGATGIAAGVTRVRWSDLVSAAAKTPLDPADGVLVIITLYGGNDGLNTVIPASDSAYQSARGQLAYAASDVLDLGQGLGLNPGMKGLHELWGSKELAIVRDVGYPYPDRSHFRSMAIWQSASPQSAVSTGWLGRWLDATTTNPLLALSVDSLVPPMLAGEKLAAASFPSGAPVPRDRSPICKWRSGPLDQLMIASRPQLRQPTLMIKKIRGHRLAARASLRHSSTWSPP